jgi:hypothetical protein
MERDEEFNKRLVDYFTSAELVDLLDVPVEELVSLLAEHIEDKKDFLEDYLNYGR